MHFEITKSNTIMLAVTGSYAYGTSTPRSDVDIRGVCIAPMSVRLSYVNKFEQFEGDVPELRDADEAPWEDATIFDVAKAVQLMANANPNMLELLFLPRYRLEDARWMRFVEHRDLFLSLKAKHTFLGYAHSQLNKIRVKKARLDGERDDTEIITRRSPERAAQERAFGFDTKHAMHLIRLMRMGLEVVKTGQMHVDRTGIDAGDLMAIRDGEWSYAKIIDESERLESMIHEAEKSSPLPFGPPHKKIDALLYEVLTWNP